MLKIYRKEYTGITFHRYIFIDDGKATVWQAANHKVMPGTITELTFPPHMWQEYTLDDGFELVGIREGI